MWLDILSSEEIKKIIKKQQAEKKTPGSNLNEYKIIKTSIELDETDCLTVKSETRAKHQEIKDIKNEVNNMNMDDDTEDRDETSDNIDDLKASILNTHDEDSS